jgi:3-isopropylmalate/(R)-2-methylmalate dehydratase small subunit
VVRFEVETSRKHILLNGLDDIGLTMQHADAIKAFEQQHQIKAPWLFG